MNAQPPADAAAYGAWLSRLSDAELDEVVLAQLAEDPELVLGLAEALALSSQSSWSGGVTLGSSVDNDASFVEVPLTEEAFLEVVLGELPMLPAVIRLNVRPQVDGSDLSLEVVLPAQMQPGIRIRCEYDVEGEDVFLEPMEGGQTLTGLSRTGQSLTAQDAVGFRLIVERDGDAVA
jgi:hypothetical protein